MYIISLRIFRDDRIFRHKHFSGMTLFTTQVLSRRFMLEPFSVFIQNTTIEYVLLYHQVMEYS